MDSVGALIREARKARGWSQAALATRLDVGRPYVSKLEAGKRAVSADLARALVRELDLDPRQVLGLDEVATT